MFGESVQKQLTIFEGIVAERDVECCKKTQIKAFCLYVWVHACVYICVGGCVCVRERVKEREWMKVESSAKSTFKNRVDCHRVVDG